MLHTETNLPAPRSAWLLLGTEVAFPASRPPNAAEGEPLSWTVSPQIEVGDTLFFYYLAPRKAIHFVGRAISGPCLDPGSEVNSTRSVDTHQWWANYDYTVEIEPIPLRDINTVCGESLVMRGRSGKYIRTEAANALLKRARVVGTVEPSRAKVALRRIVGGSELPEPASIGLRSIRDLQASLLRFELNVESHVLEPLVRLLHLPRAYRLQRRHYIGRMAADYVIFKESRPHCVIEAKLRTSLGLDRRWAESPDVRQAAGYAATLGTRYIVIDCAEVFCFDRDTLRPRLTFDRRTLTRQDLADIRDFVIREFD